MLGKRWLELKEHNRSATTSERIELQDNWMVTERISKGNKRCVTDVSNTIISLYQYYGDANIV